MFHCFVWWSLSSKSKNIFPPIDTEYLMRTAQTQNFRHFSKVNKKEKMKHHVSTCIQTLDCHTHVGHSGALHYFQRWACSSDSICVELDGSELIWKEHTCLKWLYSVSSKIEIHEVKRTVPWAQRQSCNKTLTGPHRSCVKMEKVSYHQPRAVYCRVVQWKIFARERHMKGKIRFSKT